MTTNHILTEANKYGMLQHPKEISDFVDWLQTVPTDNILEIGSCFGGTTKIFSLLAKELMVSVDLPTGEFGGIGVDSARNRNSRLASEHPNFVGILGASTDLDVIKQVKNALKGRKFDLIFVDGDHTYFGVSRDFEIYAPMLRIGGYICFHDINAFYYAGKTDPQYDVKKFWDTFYGDKFEFNIHQEWGGIGVIKL